jgi:carbon monoxide dehydrogenase subunit G
MRIESSFDVPVPPERAWEVLMDVPRVIPCLPGAELTETVDDSTWKAKMSVKVGPMTFAFATDVRRSEADPGVRRATLSAQARELRGRGGGQATIESALAAVDGGTRVDIVTDLALSGPVAQYGRGLVDDVASELIGSFAHCLESELTASPAADGGRQAPEEKEEEAKEEAVAAATATPAQPVSGLAVGAHAVRRAVARALGRLADRAKSIGRRNR